MFGVLKIKGRYAATEFKNWGNNDGYDAQNAIGITLDIISK